MERVWPECTTRSRSLQHALDVISVVTRASEQHIKVFLSSYCCNAVTLKDDFGRNATHIAASCGKKNVLDWLITGKGVDLAVKDKESGWTALHRSIFYGHIDCALSLLKHGSNLYIQDKDGYTPLDLVMKDRPPHIVSKLVVPRLVEGLRGHPCTQVAGAKDHTVVLTEDGYVYTFGLNTPLQIQMFQGRILARS
ncbi:inhibitor of Bruton tyrosine kinase-like [Xenopus laevis]|uniref:Inhibitor of Bruton tyrosine kinase-like n=1 Tax=Xenopus laevis TaxID=8355 RepID=A0A8J1KQL1_XENLA|nr:inhibitor of Bruton tyrosine kinase-like [Xenopus laevis]